MAYGEVVYDGFGNPVGLLPGISNIFKGIFGGRRRPPIPSPVSALTSLVGGGAGPRLPIRQFQPPVGWVTPAIPYTGMQPRRMYLRCSTWPGPAGMVPAALATQAQLPPGTPGGPPAPGAAGGRRRRRFRRFRRR